MDTPHTDTAITRGRQRSTTSTLLPSPTTPMTASLTLTGPPRAFTRGLLRLRPATAMAILPTAMATLMDTPRITRGRLRSTTSTLLLLPTTPMAGSLTPTGPPRASTRGLLKLSPATATPTTVTAMDTSPHMAMGTTRGQLRLSPAMAMPTTVTAMDTSPRMAMGTTRGRLGPAMVMDTATSPRTAMVTTAMATTKLFQ